MRERILHVALIFLAYFVLNGCAGLKKEDDGSCRVNALLYRRAYTFILHDAGVKDMAIGHLYVDRVMPRVMDSVKRMTMPFARDLVRIKYGFSSFNVGDTAARNAVRYESINSFNRYERSRAFRCKELAEINELLDPNLALYFSDVDTAAIEGVRMVSAEMYQVDSSQEPIRSFAKWMRLVFFFLEIL